MDFTASSNGNAQSNSDVPTGRYDTCIFDQYEIKEVGFSYQKKISCDFIVGCPYKILLVFLFYF